MSIYQDVITTISNDLKVLADNTAQSILHADLSHVDYANNKGKFQTIGFIFNLVKNIGEWIENNPDAHALPQSFLNPISSDSEPDQSSAPEVHTVTIDQSQSEA